MPWTILLTAAARTLLPSSTGPSFPRLATDGTSDYYSTFEMFALHFSRHRFSRVGSVFLSGAPRCTQLDTPPPVQTHTRSSDSPVMLCIETIMSQHNVMR